MICQKLLQNLAGMILAIVLIGCTAPTEIPRVLATTHQTPTQVAAATLNPTAMSVSISSFEECLALGYQVQNTYPRRCISDAQEIFTEALDEGVVFTKTIGGPYQLGRFITSTTDGGYLIAGASSGCWITKLDANVEKVWDSSFEQELNEEFQLSQIDFWCWLARQTPGGNYVAMGTAYDRNFGQFRKAFIITLDNQGHRMSGQLITEKAGKLPYLDREGNLIWLTSLGIEREVIETSGGGYLIVGTFPQRSPDSRIHMIRTDENGAYLWDRNLCLDKNIQEAWQEQIVCLYGSVVDGIQLQDGSFVITGSTWLLKTDHSGNVEWIRSYQQEFINAQALIQMPDDGYLIAGDQRGDGMLIKTDPVGNWQWLRTYGGDKADSFMKMEQGSNGEFIIMGVTESFGTGPYLWLVGMDSEILK